MFNTLVSTAALVVTCTALALSAEGQVIRPPGTKPGGNFSPGILVDGTLYISGQGGEDPAGRFQRRSKPKCSRRDNGGAVLKAAGMSPADVVSVQVYLVNPDHFQRMNAIYTKYFQDPRPTRTTVVVAKLVGPGNIEITATARKH
jgi:2-iminobutanoate/2-iminopropanoate deaminase